MTLEGRTLRVRKPVRLLSGVHIVTAATRPHPCPHGRCVYCPGGVQHGTPQSYVRRSPAISRALSVGYDPYLQVRRRLDEYVAFDHTPSKIELIIVGGTFTAHPQQYQEWFISNCFRAFNDFPAPDTGSDALDLEHLHRANEGARARCVGLTVETKPDWAKQRQADSMLRLGVTRVEIGVQTLNDEVLELTHRGHTLEDTVEATRVLKDNGFKVCYHMMPGLPHTTLDEDLRGFQQLFENPDYRPDMLKIYPTLVFPDTELHEMWKQGGYTAPTCEEVADLVVRIKRIVPPWVRINRVQREVAPRDVAAGLNTGNLRELVRERMGKEGFSCRCIRCREVGRQLARGRECFSTQACLTVDEYEASGGIEVFLSCQTKDQSILYGFLRLRMPSAEVPRTLADSKTALVRELHIYGPETPLDIGSDPEAFQHRGLGANLLGEAERIASERFDARRVLVTSGVGVRGYYRRRGYDRRPPTMHMQKDLA